MDVGKKAIVVNIDDKMFDVVNSRIQQQHWNTFGPIQSQYTLTVMVKGRNAIRRKIRASESERERKQVGTWQTTAKALKQSVSRPFHRRRGWNTWQQKWRTKIWNSEANKRCKRFMYIDVSTWNTFGQNELQVTEVLNKRIEPDKKLNRSSSFQQHKAECFALLRAVQNNVQHVCNIWVILFPCSKFSSERNGDMMIISTSKLILGPARFFSHPFCKSFNFKI